MWNRNPDKCVTKRPVYLKHLEKYDRFKSPIINRAPDCPRSSVQPYNRYPVSRNSKGTSIDHNQQQGHGGAVDGGGGGCFLRDAIPPIQCSFPQRWRLGGSGFLLVIVLHMRVENKKWNKNNYQCKVKAAERTGQFPVRVCANRNRFWSDNVQQQRGLSSQRKHVPP